MVHSCQILLQVLGQEDADAIEADQLTRQLRRQLLEYEVEVEFAKAGEAPPGARAGDALAIGTLVVTALTSRAVLTSVLGAVQAYLERSRARSVKIQIEDDSLEITGLSSNAQTALIKSFIDRHGEPRDAT